MEHSFKLGSNEFYFSFDSDRVDDRHFHEMDARMAALDAEMAALDAELEEFDDDDDDRPGADEHFHEEYFDERSGEFVSSRSGSYSVGPLHVSYRSQTRRSRD